MSLEDRFRQALADAISEVKSRLEAEFDATVTDVKAEADRDRTAVLALADEARAAAVAEAERQRQEAQDALARVKADADATVEAIRYELREAQASAMRVREETEAAIARLQAEHEVALAQQVEEQTAAVSRVAAEQGTVTTDLRAALDAATHERDGAVRQHQELAAEAARLRAEFDAGMSQARELAEATLASLREEAREAATLHNQAVHAHQTSALRMLESVRALDSASSLTEVLDTLTVGASKEAGRAAMLVVKGDRLIGWRTLGFGALDQEPRTIEQSTSDAGALAAAVNTGRPAVTGTGSVLAAPAFSDAPADRAGVAVPLLVAGRPVAVLYADQGTASPATGWTSPVEVLVRHAARCLEGLAVQRATAGRAAPVRVAQSA